MISHKHKCIFLHIPKAGGTSITNALGHFDDYDEAEGRPGKDHRPLRLIEPLSTRIAPTLDNGIELLRRLKFYTFPNNIHSRHKIKPTTPEYEQYLKFTFVRNPWSRAYSWYRAMKRDTALGSKFGVSQNSILLDALKENIGKDLLRPQTYWLKGYSGRIDLDFVGKFERLGEDFEKLCDMLKITATLPPPKRNVKNKIDYRTEFCDQSKQLIANFYTDEIEMFGYSFEN